MTVETLVPWEKRWAARVTREDVSPTCAHPKVRRMGSQHAYWWNCVDCHARVGYLKRTAIKDESDKKRKKEAQAAKETIPTRVSGHHAYWWDGQMYMIPPEAEIYPKACLKVTSLDQEAEEKFGKIEATMTEEIRAATRRP